MACIEITLVSFKFLLRMDIFTFANSIIDQNSKIGSDEPFFIFNLEDVRKKFDNWKEKIPRVVPYYAVKCNDDNQVLELLVTLGAGFDCASRKEILQMLKLKADPQKIIYAHTVKSTSHLELAADKGIEKMTFDCSAELMKIKNLYPNAKVVLRIRFDASNAIINLGPKFGCNPVTEAPKLIQLCKDTEMNLIGIAFHVGSGTTDYAVFKDALIAVRKLFDFAETLGMNLNFVDIGGGILGNNSTLFNNFAETINSALEKYFPSEAIEIIAEPGRYFVDTAFTLAALVILKKKSEDDHMFYYLNESIYMSFLISFLYNEKLDFSIIRKSISQKPPMNLLSTIWGCTCSSLDKIMTNILIPEIEIGDWLIFHNMGAYTTTVSTNFNGFSNKNVYLLKDK